jgi:UDP-arabinose 4-epimerase
VGFEPVTLDILGTGHSWAVQWGPFVEGDLANADLLQRVLNEHKVEAVVHFAANAYVGESMHEPRKYFHNNVTNSLNLLEAMLDTGVKRIVFSSSCATYGVPHQVPIAEDHPQQPVNPYGESKLFIERTLHWYGRAYNLEWMSLRYFNAAGADPDGELGEVHDPETHLIPIVLQTAAGERSAVPVFGTDYPTPDGTAIRDYIHVTDLAEAHVLALKYLVDGRNSLALNLGTGQGHSVQQVVRAAQLVTGRKISVANSPRREGDPPELVADPSRAQRILGWTPKYSELGFIIESAWRWQQRHAASD